MNTKQSETINHFTTEEDNFIAQCLMKNQNYSEIAIAMRRPVLSVRERISKKDFLRSIVADRKKNRKIEIYNLYKDSDLSMAKVGEKYGITRGAVRLIVIECEGGLHTSYGKRERVEFTAEEDEQIIFFKSEGKSLAFIASRLNRGKPSISSRIKTLEKKANPENNLICLYCRNRVFKNPVWNESGVFHEDCNTQRKRLMQFYQGTLPVLKTIERLRGMTEQKKEILDVLRLDKNISYMGLSKATGYDYESCKYAVNSLKQMEYIKKK